MQRTSRSAEAGFSLVEVLFAVLIVIFGVLGLAEVFTRGMIQMSSSQKDLIAKEKAAEAIESVYSARDSGVVTWDQIANEGDGGIFVDGAQTLNDPGPDGLVNTADDGGIEMLATPGPDNILGTADDEITLLEGYTRDVIITDAGPNLRQVQIVVSYLIGNETRQYTVTTLIAAFA